MPTITVEVPRSTLHPTTIIRVKHPQGESETEVDVTTPYPRHLPRLTEIELPEGVAAHEVVVTGEFCDGRGQRDPGMDAVQISVIETVSEAPKAPEDTKPAADKAPEVVIAPSTPDVPPVVVADAAPVVAADQPAADAPAAPADATPAADAPTAKATKKKS